MDQPKDVFELDKRSRRWRVRRHTIKAENIQGEGAMIEITRLSLRLGVACSLVVMSAAAFGQDKYDLGASGTEIKIGNIMPYSGPLSAFSVIGKAEAAYFAKVNAEGGINGRKINFISYDDSYSPPKTVEQTRKLVESDEVLLMFGMLGTASNTAIQKYLNSKKIPQLFLATGATKWNDPNNFPWTMGFLPSYQSEARIYAKYILREAPNAKIAILYQNDDFGKDYLKGMRDGLGEKSSMIVGESSYEVTEPTIDSHIVKLKSAGADVLVDVASPKFAAQAIKKTGELGWKPLHIVTNISTSLAAVIKPAGVENAQGLISAIYIKDVTDPRWQNDPGMKKFFAFLDQYYPDANRQDGSIAYGYAAAQTLAKVLAMCGNDLTRENVMKQAANLKNYAPDTFLPGVLVNTSPTDYAPIDQLQMERFGGESWQLIGDIMSGETTQ
jgi:branched-chain amino acid transport system substrate-binding protein